jgi:class 3 adenylate cyclase
MSEKILNKIVEDISIELKREDLDRHKLIPLINGLIKGYNTLRQINVEHHDDIKKVSELEAKIDTEKRKYKRKQLDVFAIFRIANDLTSSLELEHIVNIVLLTVMGHFGITAAALLLLNGEDTEFITVKTKGAAINTDTFKISNNSSVADFLRKEGKPILSLEFKPTCMSESKVVQDQCKQFSLVVPLICKERLSGILLMGEKSTGQEYTETNLDFLNNISHLAAIAIENAHLYTDLKEKILELTKAKDSEKVIKKYFSRNLYNKINTQRGETVHTGHGVEDDIVIMFIDIRGFTTISEKMKAEEVVKLLNVYYEKAVNIVIGNDGTLDKYIGDAMFIYWGHPNKHKNDTLLATLTALAIMDEVEALKSHALLPMDFHIGVGIHKGKATLGNIGSDERMEYTAIGDSVNIASRLCSIAPPGNILVSGSVYKEIFYDIEVGPFGKKKVKGKSEEVLTFKVNKLIKDFSEIFSAAF